jgi:C4-type Zn-finger protein
MSDQVDLTKDSAMRCPRCGDALRCMDSRPGPHNSIRRRRACVARACAYRFTTYEVAAEHAPLSPSTIAGMLAELKAAHAEMGEKIIAIEGANAAAALIKSLEQ